MRNRLLSALFALVLAPLAGATAEAQTTFHGKRSAPVAHRNQSRVIIVRKMAETVRQQRALMDAIAACEAELRHLRGKHHKAKAHAATIRHDQAKQERRAARLAVQIAELERALAQCEARNRRDRRRGGLRGDLKIFQRKLYELECSMQRTSKRLARAEDRVVSICQRVDGLKADLAAKCGERERLSNRLARLKSQLKACRATPVSQRPRSEDRARAHRRLRNQARFASFLRAATARQKKPSQKQTAP